MRFATGEDRSRSPHSVTHRRTRVEDRPRTLKVKPPSRSLMVDINVIRSRLWHEHAADRGAVQAEQSRFKQSLGKNIHRLSVLACAVGWDAGVFDQALELIRPYVPAIIRLEDLHRVNELIDRLYREFERARDAGGLPNLDPEILQNPLDN